VPVLGDGLPENTEIFLVSLSQPLNAVLDNSSGAGRIVDDDTRSLTIDDAVFVEGNAANPLSTQATLDSLAITRNGALFFSDAFGDGVAPPSAPNFANGTPASYSVQGTLEEANSRVTFNAAGASLTPVSATVPFTYERALLLTNIDPADLASDSRATTPSR
jgi:hypothetical protein